MFFCFSVDKNGVSEGIPADDYDCLLADGDGLVSGAELRFVPALDNVPDPSEQLCLAFLRKTDGGSPEPGAVVSVDPSAWALASDRCGVRLLHPCGRGRNALLLLDDSGVPALRSVWEGRQFNVHVPRGGHVPVMSPRSEAASLLDALGVDQDELFSGPRESRPAGPKARKAASRKPAKAAAPGSARARSDGTAP